MPFSGLRKKHYHWLPGATLLIYQKRAGGIEEKLKKWLGIMIMAGWLCFGPGTCLATSSTPPEYELHLVVDGNELELDNPIFIKDDRTMISLEGLKATFECDALSEPGQINITWRDTFIIMFPDRDDYVVNTVVKQAGSAPLIKADGSIYVPLRFIAQELEYDISFEPLSATVFLHSEEYKPDNPVPSPAPVPIPPPASEFKPSGNWGAISEIPPFWVLTPGEEFVTGYYTRLLNSPPGRTTNIALSCARIDGKVLQPGDIFSFNQVVGERTGAAGYKAAAIFAGKKVVTGIGGGICQTASTMYNLALEAGFQVMERHPHSLKVVYVAPQRDATVSWGTADLKFSNTLDFPVKILCQVEGDLVITALVKTL